MGREDRKNREEIRAEAQTLIRNTERTLDEIKKDPAHMRVGMISNLVFPNIQRLAPMALATGMLTNTQRKDIKHLAQQTLELLGDQGKKMKPTLNEIINKVNEE